MGGPGMGREMYPASKAFTTADLRQRASFATD
jgi:hypothetical protein